MTQTGEIIEAKPGSYYRNMRYLMAGLLAAMGAWFAYDGWVAYPKQNIEFREKKARVAELVEKRTALEAATDPAQKAEYEQYTTEQSKLDRELKDLKEHSEWDLMLQRGLGFVLPPLGMVMLAWALYNSRGMVRLRGETLEVPGHPPIPLDAITSMDTTLWDRKGIAYVEYNVGGKSGRARLDDFIYDRKPIDLIYELIAARLGGGSAGGGMAGGGMAAEGSAATNASGTTSSGA